MINTVFQELETKTDMAFVFIIIFTILLWVLPLGLTFFFNSMGDKTQLFKHKIYVFSALITAIPAYIFLYFKSLSFDAGFVNQFPILLITITIFLFIWNSIVKRIAYRTIPFEEFRKLKTVEKDRIILKVEDLKTYYPLYKGFLKRHVADVKAVNGVSFELKSGETLGLVGESGCGKTTIARTILGLVKKESGMIYFNGEPLTHKFTQQQRQMIQVIYQDPDASLNPRKKVIDIIAEPFRNLMGITNNIELRKRVLKLLQLVSLKREHLDRYPHEFSGGQKQRIIIARALACNPHLIILDEPTSALDVSVQAQILNLLKDLQQNFGYAYLFITHDLSVIHHVANRVAIMYLGMFVETGSIDQIFNNPMHPYSKALLSARSSIDPEHRRKKLILKGEVPSPIYLPPGCYFNPRCSSDVRTPECEIKKPHKMKIDKGHYIWCVNPPKGVDIIDELE
ncbi:MAG: ABC transporter ATP-binding protein [Candidatus Thorarchaeota archaeon]